MITTVQPDDPSMYSNIMSYENKAGDDFYSAYTGSEQMIFEPRFVQLIPIAGLQYSNTEEFRPHLFYDDQGVAQKMFDSTTFEEAKKDKSVLSIETGDDICNGNYNMKYDTEYLKTIFSQEDLVRVPVGRVWVQPLHNSWNNRNNPLNIVGFDANRSTRPLDGISLNGHLSYNGAQVYHSVEIELLASHCDVF